ncbi:MAG: carbamoyltransferase HypF [Spirochaetia bacterium]|nr:carbamoyltransferase HypF [Spirochaetia bacterium]
MITSGTKTLDIEIQGRIQGVGFRPFIYRLASDYNLYGWVNNQTSHVKIHVEGIKNNVDSFVKNITLKAPPISIIDHLETSISNFEAYKDFTITKSIDSSNTVTEISPDLAVCSDCLEDIKSEDRRYAYAFTNCTNCGPRFSIIKDLPYDRSKTTMKDFQMCPECQEEYTSPMNRRFHAQPNSCSKCGPSYSMVTNKEKILDIHAILLESTRIIQAGGILAVKGIGGFHFACDPFNQKAIKKLREIKKRDSKPFAVMFSSVNDIRKYADVSNKEEESLKSVQAPIIILKQKYKTVSPFPSELTAGLNSIACFLPYTPFHHMLIEKLHMHAMVLTSGNISCEPIEINNDQALHRFLNLCDGVLTYNRDIQNRTDDSVVRVINSKKRLFRRSRGWAPESITVNANTDGILATGSELKNCFCIGKSNKAILSQHIGGLKNLETFEFYKESIKSFKNLFRFNQSLIAHDLHPDYLSTSCFDNSRTEKIAIQHHHAHIASCMAENAVSDRVIGFSFDGTGLGDDGHIWGGEVFICNFIDYKRHFHFKYLPQPGGDKAVEEPWRMAVSALYSSTGREFLGMDLPFLKQIPISDIETLLDIIDKGINCPLTSSTGRIFDGVSALLGLCSYSSFDAEAPIRLEDVLDQTQETDKFYPFILDKEISMAPAFRAITEDILNKTNTGLISAKFHNTIVEIICRAAMFLRSETGINKVALSGGVFMNGYLLENAEKKLALLEFEVLTHSRVPSNDGGLALGQLAIAAHTREQRRKELCV